MTDQAIDITGWQMTKNVGGVETLMYTISTSNSIPANGYFLISEFDKDHSALNVDPDIVVGTGTDDDADFELSDTNLQIKLYQGDWTDSTNLVDTADDGSDVPAVGLSTLDGSSVYYSMERNAIPGDGADANNWHTTFADTSSYFDSGLATTKGTPKASNQ